MASWASSMVRITLVVSLGAVGAHVGPQLWKFPDGKTLVQGQLGARHGQELACTHFTPGRFVQHWSVVRSTGLAVVGGPVLLGDPR